MSILKYFMWTCLSFTLKGLLVTGTAQKCKSLAGVFSLREEKAKKKTHSLFIKGKENPRPLDREVNPSRPNRSWTVVSRKQQVTVTDWELGSRQMPGSWTV